VDGKYLISSDYKGSIIYDLKTMEPIFDEGIRFVSLYSHNRICNGVILDGLYMKWTP
jgi:hypothetical protein